MKVVFTEDHKEMLEVEKLLVKRFNFRWSILQNGMLLLREKFKDDKFLKDKGGVCISLRNDNTMTWSYGVIFKRSADKSTDAEVVDAKTIITNPDSFKQ
jgi:hypothetical protein